MSRDYRVVAEGLFLERASSDAIKALRQAGVRAVLLKGPLQQWWLEAGGPPRASVDVDLLVSRDQLDRAGAVLGTLGYSLAVMLPDEPGREHSTAWVAVDRVPVELHWSLVGVDENKVWDVLSSETETAVLMREQIEIPNEAARCAIVALHAAQHGIGQPAIFGDLEKALVITETETWRRASELATALGAWTPFAGALSLTPRGRELLGELGAGPPVLGEREALSLLTPAPTSRGFFFLWRQRGVRAKAVFLLAKLAPPPEFMRLRYPVARSGSVGLTIAYLYRPFWLARWAMPGFRTWRQARRLARASSATTWGSSHEVEPPSLKSEPMPPATRGRLLVVSHASVLPVNQHVYRKLVELGWDLTLVVPSRWRHQYRAGGFPSRALLELEQRIVRLPVVFAGRPQRHVYLTRPGRLIRRLAPQAILLEEETFSIAAAQWGFAAGRAGVPFGVQAAENMDRPLPWIAKVLRRRTLRRAEFVTARSPAAAALAKAWGAEGRVEVVPHAVPGWDEVPKPAGRPFTIGYGGRLVPEKGVRDLVAAATRLEDPLRLLFVGDGRLRAELESSTLAHGTIEVRANVSHDEMPQAYAEMDVLVLPSRSTRTWTEQFGRVLVEALSCGVPVVGSDCGEIPWVIETTGGGRVFPEGDVDRLAEVLGELRTNPREAADLAERGRANVNDMFGVEAVARELDRLLLDLGAQAEARAPNVGAGLARAH
jgi:glycosyltransferase involved in cell wall biosynthesis